MKKWLRQCAFEVLWWLSCRFEWVGDQSQRVSRWLFTKMRTFDDRPWSETSGNADLWSSIPIMSITSADNETATIHIPAIRVVLSAKKDASE